MPLVRVFQIALKGGGRKSPLRVRGNGIFYQMMGNRGGGNLTLQTFFKAKNNILQMLNIS